MGLKKGKAKMFDKNAATGCSFEDRSYFHYELRKNDKTGRIKRVKVLD